MQGTLVDGQCRKHGYYVVKSKKEDSEFFDKLLREISHLIENMKCQKEELEEYLSLKKVADAVNKRGRQEILFVHGKKKEHLFFFLDGRKQKKEIWKKDQLVFTKFYGEIAPEIPKVEEIVTENRKGENIIGVVLFVVLAVLWGIKYFEF
ncbi:hypothetical protein [Brazilian marseillevirus]|uniref:hypothetical protein n=1 Tax=Brazilian marseillevirus TaxID=1813599 RepID=UPI0007832300|nr:hypothetical protein A3303_gp403 [Brazilian marseillevirus]AMQ10911.1 hypothetical protein [Brazilian marseillevirus]